MNFNTLPFEVRYRLIITASTFVSRIYKKPISYQLYLCKDRWVEVQIDPENNHQIVSIEEIKETHLLYEYCRDVSLSQVGI
ncbi:hypothetical protein [Algivirga pacifica]|uniref:Uncharacterized protein n=1 Tax=Algivirga pacifica TaxID=1162670 RepID=A0ABP9CZC0_9BACT